MVEGRCEVRPDTGYDRLASVTSDVVRYRFNEFTLCPRRRLLVREGREVPLIPRYFDLLLLLIERRREAVHRREIFERVWADAIVSESALSQAVRTIRRALDDDPREPRFIRTVSRHGYRFVFPDVIEEDEEDERRARRGSVYRGYRGACFRRRRRRLEPRRKWQAGAPQRG